jgi:hypothetical protein
MGPRNAYKDMLDNVVSPITCVSMIHQNQLEQMANGVMFAIDIYGHHMVWLVGVTAFALAIRLLPLELPSSLLSCHLLLCLSLWGL